MIQASFDIERRYRGEFPVILGVDEAGRGPLAGPVVAAVAQYRWNDFDFSEDVREVFRFVRDSKELSEKNREYAYGIVQEHFEIGIGIVDAATIDRVNILQATFLAMREAILQITGNRKRGARIMEQGTENRKRAKRDRESNEGKVLLLVDGNKVIPDMPYKQEAVVKGDSLSYSIAAASIVAKVVRDRMMYELDKVYPQYGFARHKGYGTAAHLSALQTFGPILEHRRSFAPVRRARKMIVNVS